MTDCILLSLTNIKILTGHKHASNSIIVRANYNDQAVVVKITAQSPKDNNSLDIERDLYLFVDKIVTPWSPHFLGGIRAQQCNLGELEGSTLFRNAEFTAQWNRLRGNLLLTEHKEPDTFIAESKIAQLKREFQLKNDLGKWWEYVSQHTTVPYFRELHFIVTPRVDAKTVYEHLQSKNILSSTFDMHVAIQVAQALCVAQKFGFMHNDLHGGNIFVIEHATEKQFHYKFPFDFMLDSRYEVKIFDYDLSTLQNEQIKKTRNKALDNSLCDKIGACNEFTPNYDWDLFLTVFVSILEQKRYTPLRSLVGGEFRSDLGPPFGGQGEQAMFGHDCRCVQVDETKPQDDLRCVKCVRERNPNIASTPIMFLESKEVDMFIQRPTPEAPPKTFPLLYTTVQFGVLSEEDWKQKFKENPDGFSNLVDYATAKAPRGVRRRALRYNPYRRPEPKSKLVDDLTRIHL
jgi:serine/threonine protein kinase